VGSQRGVKLWREKQNKPIRNEEIEEEKRKKKVAKCSVCSQQGELGNVRKEMDEKSG